MPVQTLSGIMNESLQVVTLKGPITVTYREEGADVYATALQFDLVGIGKTREAALNELQEIFSEYAEEVLNTKGKARFYNPSDPEEWENPDKEFFSVTFVLSGKRGSSTATSVCNIRELHAVRRSVRTIQLQQCYV